MIKKDELRLRIRFIVVVLSVIPLILFAVLGYALSVDMPVMDQWEFVYIMDAYHSGHLTLGQLWAQYNEHRMFFPRLIRLALGILTQWDLRYEVVAGIFLSAVSYMLICYQISRTHAKIAFERYCWLFPVASVLVFSPSQWECLFDGMLQVYLQNVCIIGGFILLSQTDLRWYRLGLAMLAGFVAAFSFGSGLLFGLVGLAVLVERCSDRGNSNREGWVAAAIVWLIFVVAVIGLYALDYHKPDAHPSLWYGAKHSLALLKYVGLYLASPMICPVGTVNVAIGFSALILFAACAGWLWHYVRQDQRMKAACTPWMGLALFALSCAILTGISRVGFGWEQASSSRYAPIPTLFGVSVLVLCNRVTLSEQFSIWADKTRIGAPQFRRIFAWAVCAVMVLCLSSAAMRTQDAILAMGSLPAVKDAIGSGEKALNFIPDNYLPYPDRDKLRDYFVPTLRRLSLSLFRERR